MLDINERKNNETVAGYEMREHKGEEFFWEQLGIIY